MDINLTTYLIFTGCSVAVCFLWYFLALRREMKAGKAAAACAVSLALGVLLGIACARLGWVLMRIETRPPLFALAYDELSFFGGMAGVILAVFLAAKLFRLPVRKALNAFAPAGALLAALMRFAEGFLGLYGVGYVEDWIETGVFFPVTVEVAWDEYYSEFYFAVFMLSGLFSLIAMVLSLVHGRERNRFIRTLFYLCLPQILCESLRLQAIVWLFVKEEQLLCFLVCEVILAARAVKAGAGRFRSWIPALAGLAVCGVLVALEFAIDGKITVGENMIPLWVSYLVMTAALAAMAVMEHVSNRMLTGKKA